MSCSGFPDGGDQHRVLEKIVETCRPARGQQFRITRSVCRARNHLDDDRGRYQVFLFNPRSLQIA
jgi:hypothetical protein